ncbi:MAG: transcription repressor NadR [Actinomycetaceae bacterium]|nr:transcription repressor NadR [Actinomycetaceae bacterium]
MSRNPERMSSGSRLQHIRRALTSSDTPVSATQLGQDCGVTRQVIVKDIALLRAKGVHIISTNRGYMLASGSNRPRRTFNVRHEPSEIERELSLIIDLGGHVLDVEIDHEVYGPISAKLDVHSPVQLRKFLDEFAPSHALARLTNGYHRHTVEAESEPVLDDIENALREAKILVD